MISEKLQNAINEQITAEMWSSNLYLSMSFYLQKEGFDGFASWMRKQSQEELQHAYDLADYLVKRGGAAKVDKIDVVPQGWGSVQEVFEHVYKHECHVSSLIDEFKYFLYAAPSLWNDINFIHFSCTTAFNQIIS